MSGKLDRDGVLTDGFPPSASANAVALEALRHVFMHELVFDYVYLRPDVSLDQMLTSI
jgi:hypothetical protein